MSMNMWLLDQLATPVSYNPHCGTMHSHHGGVCVYRRALKCSSRSRAVYRRAYRAYLTVVTATVTAFRTEMTASSGLIQSVSWSKGAFTQTCTGETSSNSDELHNAASVSSQATIGPIHSPTTPCSSLIRTTLSSKSIHGCYAARGCLMWLAPTPTGTARVSPTSMPLLFTCTILGRKNRRRRSLRDKPN